MKALITSVITAMNTGITAGTLSAARVYKGFQNNPEEIPRKFFPYVAIDEQGERTTEDGVKSETAINRIYSVGIEFAVWTNSIDGSLDAILDLSNQVRAIIELQANRFKDSHIWGIFIKPFEWVQEEKYFFRGRQVTVEYYDLQDRYNDY